MSKTIDEKVVSMQFDNRHFEQNVKTSLGTLDKLKQSLKFDGAVKGFNEIDASAKKCDLSPLSNGIETVKMKFSALQVMAVTALSNITNSAVNTAKKMVSALTVEPIKAGFSEYETKMNSVQTIMSNTASKGTTMTQVTAVLDDLNTYADKTIYNFAEMTRNIGTFTAAGVGLKDAASAIKGIANLAAASGSNSQQASTAMYQLSQALATGTVKLMDWNSVVNAGMGGEKFQNALKDTAREMGVSIDNIIEKNGSFRESLQEGWLTADILNTTLNKFTVDGAKNYAKSMMESGKWTQEQADALLKEAQAMEDAATKVKTFTQLWDTLKEAAQSGWAQSWEIIVGDFNEAKDLLTNISDTIGGMIGATADARNDLLNEGLSTGWKQLLSEGIADSQGYIDSIKEVARQNGDSFDKMCDDSETFEDALKKGLSEGIVTSDTMTTAVDNLATKMGNMSAEELEAAGYTQEHVEQIKKLSAGLKDGSVSMEEFTAKIQRASGRENLIQALWNAFEGLMSVIKPIKEAFTDIFPPATGEQLYALTERIRDFTAGLKLSEEKAEKIKATFKGLFSILDILRQAILAVTKPFFEFFTGTGVSSFGDMILTVTASIGNFFTKLNEGIKAGDGFSIVGDTISGVLDDISNAIQTVCEGFGGFSGILSSIGDTIGKVFDKIKDTIGGVVNWIRENISGGDIFAGLAGGGIFILAKKLGGAVDKAKEIFEKIKDIFGGFSLNGGGRISQILDSIHDSLTAFSQGIKVASLVGIAVAITLLSSSLKKISEIEPAKIAYSLATISVMIKMLNGGFKSLTKTLSKFKSAGTIKAAIAMIAMAKAIDILADAMSKVAELDLEEIGKGLAGVGGLLLELSLAMKILNKNTVSLRTSVAILALAKACEILADALGTFAELTWEEIARGLAAMGGALAEFTAVLAVLGKVGGGKALLGSVGLLIAAQALDEISENLERLSKLSWEEIGRGLGAMGGALVEFTAVLAVLSKVGGFGAVLGGAAILIAAQSLDEIAENLERLGKLSWEEIGRGLGAMGGALAEFTIALSVLSAVGGFGAILGGTAILIAVQSLDEISENLERLSKMSWEEIGRGLGAMGGALTELSLAAGLLGGITGFGGLIGAGSILVAVQALDPLAEALQKFGSMQWDEIGRGLTAMGGALAELALVCGGLGFLTGFAGLVGAGTILLAVQGLDDLANALIKFGDMSWDEIGRGLTAMGAALGEVALGSLANTLSGLGALAIAEVAKPLGDLADSVMKWTKVTVPDGLSEQLGMLAAGIRKFTFDGLGASAIAEVAEPLGVMADSVKKWVDVKVPDNIGEQLSSLAGGILSFTFAGLGANSISTVAEPLGALADSVKKWYDVKVPETLQEDLTGLSEGIKGFTWLFLAGWSLSTITGPLGDLSDSVKKWYDVKVPDTLQEDLTALSEGIKGFEWLFLAGWSLSAICGPLGELAGEVTKWADVQVRDGLKEDLTELSEGIEKFSWLFLAAWSIAALVEPLGNFVDVVKKWNGVNVPDGIKDKLTGLATGIKEFKDIDLSNFADETFATAIANIRKLIYAFDAMGTIELSGIDTLKTALDDLGKISVDGLVTTLSTGADQVASAISNLISSISSSISSGSEIIGTTALGAGQRIGNQMVAGIQAGTASISGIMYKVMSGMANAVNSGAGPVVQAFNSAMVRSLQAVSSRQSGFRVMGIQIADALQNGIKSGLFNISDAFSTAMSTCTTVLNLYYYDFYECGTYVGQGFAAGIEDSAYAAEVAAEAMAKAAIEAAEEAVDMGSPSKEFHRIGMYSVLGFANGLKDYSSTAEDASANLGLDVVKSMQRVLDINSPSKVTRDEVGRYIVEGVAEGIKANMTAEEAAAQKAQNIVNAFKTELDKFDLDMTTSDLEYQLWEKLKGDKATDAEKAAANMANLTAKLQNQNEKVLLAQGEYQQTLSTLGETNEKTQEAYNKYLQEQIKLADLSNQINEIQSTAVQQNRDAMNNYYDYLRENEEKLLDLGFKLEDIEALARKETGYDPEAVVTNMTTDVTKIISDSMGSVQTVYQKSVENTMGSMNNTFGEVGTNYASAVSEGIQGYAPNVIPEIQNMLITCSDTIKGQQDVWIKMGEYLVDGLIQGIRSKSEQLCDEVRALGNAMQYALGVAQPDSVFTELGKDAGEDLVTAINNVSGVEPSITPVMSLSGIDVKTLSKIGSQTNAPDVHSVESTNTALTKMQAELAANNKEFTTAVGELKTNVAHLTSVVENKDTSLYMNSKVVAKSLAKDMDRQLSVLAKRGAY